MIFKTFNNDTDKISAKWGIFGRSFNDIGNAILAKITSFNEEFEQTGKIFSSWNNSDSVWKRLYPSKADIQSQLIDVDSVLPKIDENEASNVLNLIKSIEDGTYAEAKSFQELYDTGDKTNQWIAQYAQETKEQIRSTEDVVKANQQARDTAIVHNNALKQQTLGAKATKVAMSALATAGNMLLVMAISKGIEWLITYNQRLEESRQQMIEAVKEAAQLTEDLDSLVEQYRKLGADGKLDASDKEQACNIQQKINELLV